MLEYAIQITLNLKP